MAAESALKNLLEPGTHRCRWTLSKPGEPTSWEVDGDVELVARRQPRGGVYGKAPANWAVTPRGGRSGGFPQDFDYPIIRGELNGGLDIVLLDAQLTVFGEVPREGPFHFKGANAYLNSWAALVGRHAPTSDNLVVDAGVIQLTHLDAFAARSPLESQTFPGDDIQQHADPTWSATFDKTSVQEWQDDDAEVKMHYYGTMPVGGWYGFNLKFSPVVEIKLKKPIPLAQFMTQWAWPLQGIISASTGSNERINSLTCSPVIEGDDRPWQRRQFQVFQASVLQEPYASTNDLRDKDVSAIRLSEGESLLQLLRRWQQLEQEQNPILNTYEADALGPDQTPRARFLLLLQALEGLYGFENRIANQLAGFAAKRDAILAKCRETDALTGAEFRWLDANVRKTPWNLENVLREMLAAVPADLDSELANCELVKDVVAEPDSNADTSVSALRYVRNHLSHGTKTFDSYQLHDAASILQRAVRGHLLRLLDASESAQRRAVKRPDR